MSASMHHGGVALELSRWFDASPARLFELFTSEEYLREWWGPRDFMVESLDFPAIKGATYRVVSRGPDGSVFEHVGEILSVMPPERLCYSWRWLQGPMQRETSIVELQFIEERGGTRVDLVHSRFVDEQSRDAHVGWPQAFVRLQEFLGGEAGSQIEQTAE